MRDSIARAFAICWKEVTELRRDRLTFGMVVMIPLMQLLLFGYTISTDVRHVPIVVVDEAQTSFSRQLVMDVTNTQVVDLLAFVDTPAEGENWVRQGHAAAALVIPHDVERRYYANAHEPIAQVVVDGSDTVVAAAVSSLRAFPFLPGGGVPNRSAVSTLEVELLYNPQQRAELFTVPGLMGIILTMTMVMFTAIAIVRERERGNLELLIATPVQSIELMVGKIIPYMVIGLIQVGIVLLLGRLLFAMPMVGSIWLLLFCCLLFIFANLGLGLLISTKAPNQLGAMQMSFFLMLPSILLSGFMFPLAAMPHIAQVLAEVLPMTHFMRLARAVILRGADFYGLVGDIAFLAVFFVITMTLAVFGFRSKLD